MVTPEKLLDQVLILRFQAGDISAFDAIVERYHGRLSYFVRRLLGSLDSADDVLQNVWVIVYKQLPSLGNPEAFSVWLHKIARNKALQELRKNRRYTPLNDENIQLPEIEEEPEEFSAEDAAKIHAALDKLKPEHREVLVLRFLEEMPYQEIAEVAGVSLGTVKSRIYYAKRALRRTIEEMNNERR